MRNKIGTICMLLGAVLLLAALSLFLWNRRENNEAGASVEKILPLVVEQIKASTTNEPKNPDKTDSPEETERKPIYPDPYDPAMTEVKIDGYAYIGYLSIPSLKLELPIMSEWSYKQLKIAPCRYAGSTKTDDLVIAAHNYTRHFGPIKSLTSGDWVYFTDMDGVVSVYEVIEVDILQPTAVEEMTSGEFALTLFTCTYSGKTRVTVRCERIEPK